VGTGRGLADLGGLSAIRPVLSWGGAGSSKHANYARLGHAQMLPLPRVAVGTVQPGVDLQPMLWAMMEALRQRGLQVQSFLSRAWFARYHGEAGVTGLNPRHLDSWLMTPKQCRDIFVRGAEACDLAVVEGEFAHPLSDENPPGGRLDTLCNWLDLPVLVLLDAYRIERRRLPKRPEQADGLLLDRVSDGRHLAELTTNLEAFWGIPVLGALEVLPALRAEVHALPGGGRPSRELLGQLGRQFFRHGYPERVVELASRRQFVWPPTRLFALDRPSPPMVVALAYDNALNCYFPDTLDLLESCGARIVDFSPLRDERLPGGTDIVYLGCGHPERLHEAGLAEPSAQRGPDICRRWRAGVSLPTDRDRRWSVAEDGGHLPGDCPA